MVWHTFYHWIHGYWHAAKSYIEDRQQRDSPLIWKDFRYLYNRVIRYEKRERGCSDADLVPCPDAIRKFLKDEP
jgi:hypothetical protein